MAKDNNTLLKGITAVLLAGVMVGGGVAIGYGAATDWTYKKTTVTQEENKDNENGGSVVADGESSGMSILSKIVPLASYTSYGIDARDVENVYDLSVTYTPADTTYQDTTYSIAFKNPSSTWATGKKITDYAKITQSSAGSKDAVLQVLKPFSEQIIVTATCNRNTSIKASVTVDFVGTNYGTISFDTLDDCEYPIEFTYQGLQDGTIAPSTDNCFTFVFDFTEYGYERISQSMSASGYTFASSVSYTYTPNDLNSSFDVTDLRNILYKAGGMESASTAEKKAYWEALSSAMLNGNMPEDLNGNQVCSYEVISHRTFNGVDYADNIIIEGALSLSDWYHFEVSATGMSSNISSIIAG